MECSICFAAIEKSVTTLSCGHHFHLGCIGRWILKNESCPLCRHEMEEHEKIAEDVEEDEEEDYESEYDSEEEESDYDELEEVNVARVNGRWRELDESHKMFIPKFDPEAHAFWVLRTTFEKLESGEQFVTPTEKVEERPILSYKTKRIIRRVGDGRTLMEVQMKPVFETLANVYKRTNKVQFRVEEEKDDEGYLSA